MKKKLARLMALVLTFCLLGSSTALASSDQYSTVELLDGNVIETVRFEDTDEKTVTMIKTTRPDNTFSLETIKDGSSRVIAGEADYNIALTFLPENLQNGMPRNIEVYLGTNSRNSYVGPEYKTLSELAGLLSEATSNMKLEIALSLAEMVFDAYSSPVPLWIKKVTDTYEVHGEGDIGFLGYYHMYDWFYIYDHNDTTGPDFIATDRADRYDTTPGV